MRISPRHFPAHKHVVVDGKACWVCQFPLKGSQQHEGRGQSSLSLFSTLLPAIENYSSYSLCVCGPFSWLNGYELILAKSVFYEAFA